MLGRRFAQKIKEKKMTQIFEEKIRNNSYDNIWEESQKDRKQIINNFPFSVTVQLHFLEMDQGELILNKAIGKKQEQWDFYFYYKESYDFGYGEYFFKTKNEMEKFEKMIPEIYGKFPDGEKFKTNEEGEIIKI